LTYNSLQIYSTRTFIHIGRK